jgi:polysaccharide deacetylase 2 family uncharacterized protein YibQ
VVWRLALAALVVVVLLASGAVLLRRGGPTPGASDRPRAQVVQDARATFAESVRVDPVVSSDIVEVPPLFLPAEVVTSAVLRIALVIDDLGRSVGTIDRLLALGVPLSYSVLPFESRTPEVVARVREAGAELLCHVPMEARSGLDPGPGALVRGMSDEEIRLAASRALDQVPGAVGANNHMGSAFSEDAAAMGTFLEVVAAGGLFFLDSRTTADTIGFRTALDLGIPAAERKVFLDRDRRPEAIRSELARVLEAAARGEMAIAIGHPHEETLVVLEEEIPLALAAGYRFVTVSDLLASSR